MLMSKHDYDRSALEHASFQQATLHAPTDSRRSTAPFRTTGGPASSTSSPAQPKTIRWTVNHLSYAWFGQSHRGHECGCSEAPVASADNLARDEEFQSDLLTLSCTPRPKRWAHCARPCPIHQAQDEAGRLRLCWSFTARFHALTARRHRRMPIFRKWPPPWKCCSKSSTKSEKHQRFDASHRRHCIDFIAELFNKGVERASLSAKKFTSWSSMTKSFRVARLLMPGKGPISSTSLEDPAAPWLMQPKQLRPVFSMCKCRHGWVSNFAPKSSTAGNKTTPVILVTSLTDFKSRARPV